MHKYEDAHKVRSYAQLENILQYFLKKKPLQSYRWVPNYHRSENLGAANKCSDKMLIGILNVFSRIVKEFLGRCQGLKHSFYLT